MNCRVKYTRDSYFSGYDARSFILIDLPIRGTLDARRLTAFDMLRKGFSFNASFQKGHKMTKQNLCETTDCVSSVNRLPRGCKPKISVDAPGRAGSVGERVKKLRLALGYSRAAFAEALGVDWRRVKEWEKNESAVGTDEVDAICRAWDVDPLWILFGSGRPFPNFFESAQSFLLCPKSPFLRDEFAPFDAKAREKTRRFVAALSPKQRGRALLFYSNLVAALAWEDKFPAETFREAF